MRFGLVCSLPVLLFGASVKDRINRWGVSMHYRWAGAPGETAMLEKGFKVARTDFVWGEVEQRKGVYTWDNYDALVDELLAHHVQPMLILVGWGTPSFYDQSYPPFDYRCKYDFLNFCMAAIERYAGKNVIWELWNEPNIPKPEWPGVSWTGKEYGDVAVALGQQMESKGFGDELLVGPATSGFALDFLNDVFATGALDYLDAITVHPYQDVPETAIWDWSGTGSWDRLRDIIKQHGHDKVVMSGEWGWNTCQKPCDNHWGNYGLSETEQASFLARQWLLNWINDVPSIFYQFNTWPNCHASSFESNFGVVRCNSGTNNQPFEPKPAYLAAAALQRFFPNNSKWTYLGDQCGLANIVIRGDNSQGAISYGAYNFNPSKYGDENIAVPVSPAGCYEVYDMLGALMDTRCSPDGADVIEVPMRTEPVYLVSKPDAPATPPAPTPVPEALQCAVNLVSFQDCQGNDLGHQGGVVNAQKCCEICAESAGCAAFTHRYNTCYLKSGCSGTTHCGDCTYGVVSTKTVELV